MRKPLSLLSLGLVLAAAVVFAQDATLTSPIARSSEAKYVITQMCVTQGSANIEVAVQDSGNSEIRRIAYVVPDAAHPGATVAGIFTALDTARGGEAGGVMRRANFRLLGFLSDNGYLPAATLNP